MTGKVWNNKEAVSRKMVLMKKGIHPHRFKGRRSLFDVKFENEHIDDMMSHLLSDQVISFSYSQTSKYFVVVIRSLETSEGLLLISKPKLLELFKSENNKIFLRLFNPEGEEIERTKFDKCDLVMVGDGDTTYNYSLGVDDFEDYTLVFRYY